jgi:16S rRNA processing protein RimM
MVRAALISDNVSSYRKMYDASGHELGFKVVRYVGGKAAVLALDGVHDRSAAMLLRGRSFFIKRSDLPPLDEGEFHLCDLVGREIVLVDENGVAGESYASIGGNPRIVDVYNFGAGDILEISWSGGSTFLVPFTRENFPPPPATGTDGLAAHAVQDDNNIAMALDAFNCYKDQ